MSLLFQVTLIDSKTFLHSLNFEAPSKICQDIIFKYVKDESIILFLIIRQVIFAPTFLFPETKTTTHIPALITMSTTGITAVLNSQACMEKPKRRKENTKKIGQIWQEIRIYRENTYQEIQGRWKTSKLPTLTFLFSNHTLRECIGTPQISAISKLLSNIFYLYCKPNFA